VTTRSALHRASSKQYIDTPTHPPTSEIVQLYLHRQSQYNTISSDHQPSTHHVEYMLLAHLPLVEGKVQQPHTLLLYGAHQTNIRIIEKENGSLGRGVAIRGVELTLPMIRTHLLVTRFTTETRGRRHAGMCVRAKDWLGTP